MDGTAGIGATSNADNGHFRQAIERGNRCGTTGLVCTVYACGAAATGVAETSDNRGVITSHVVCDGHAGAFLEAVRALQLHGLVRGDFLGCVRAVGEWDQPIPYTLAVRS